MSNIYVAHPIDRDPTNRERVYAAIHHIKRMIEGRNDVGFFPGLAFGVGMKAEVNGFILEVNSVALDNSHGLLVIWPKGATSWGVPAEVRQAIDNGAEVVIVMEDRADITWAWPTEQVEIVTSHDGDNLTLASLAAVGYYALRARLHKANAVPGESTQGDPHEACGGPCETRPTEPFHPDGDRAARGDVPTILADPEITQRILPWADLDEFGERVTEPSRAHADDAGLDLYVSERTVIKPGEFKDIPSGVGIELPSDVWAMLQGRSSTLRTKGLLVHTGVIDPGYRGELYAGVWNLGSQTVIVEAGERIAQVILQPNITPQFKLRRVDELGRSERGVKGFGSSGS